MYVLRWTDEPPKPVTMFPVRAELARSSAYRHLSTKDLLTDREAVGWDLAEIAAEPGTWEYVDESRSYLEHVAGELDREIARRRKLAHLANAPSWPAKQRDRAEEWAAIKARADLVTVVQTLSLVALYKRGKDWVGCCPLPDHVEDTPSFKISQEKQQFYCFGCHRGGDVFTYVQMLMGLDTFVGAVEVVAALTGYQPPSVRVNGAKIDIIDSRNGSQNGSRLNAGIIGSQLCKQRPIDVRGGKAVSR